MLVFSQFKIMLDVIEDALRMADFPLERIDGSVAQKDRQGAIDRFSSGEWASAYGWISNVSLDVLCARLNGDQDVPGSRDGQCAGLYE